MMNVMQVSGLNPTPISKKVLTKGIPSKILQDANALTNYEVMKNILKGSSLKAPSTLIASGDGTTPVKSSQFSEAFYSSNILARDSYKNYWISGYAVNGDYLIGQYDGTSSFKRLRIEANTGKLKTRSLEIRNGNAPKVNGHIQHLFGYASDSSTNEESTMRHNIRTSHSSSNVGDNTIDFYLWDQLNDDVNAAGTKHAVRINGAGNLEIINGCHVDGGVDIDISTSANKLDEQAKLAIPGKGVIYYNSNSKVNRYRYSENGKPFKYFGSGSGSDGNETCNLRQCTMYGGLESNCSIGVYMYTESEIEINSLTMCFENGGTILSSPVVAIYANTILENVSHIWHGPSESHFEKICESEFDTIFNGDNVMHKHTLTSNVTVKGWYCIVIRAPESQAKISPFMSCINESELFKDSSTASHAMQFIRNDLIGPTHKFIDTFQPNITGDQFKNNSIVPYIKIGVA